MAIEPCVVCDCIPGNISPQKFNQDVEIILCGILAALTDDIIPVAAAPITPSVPVTVAFGAITGTYQLASGIVGSGVVLGYLHIQNNTDADIKIGISSTQDWITVFATESRDIQLPIQTPGSLGGIYYKYTGAAPTQGTLYIEGGHY